MKFDLLEFGTRVAVNVPCIDVDVRVVIFMVLVEPDFVVVAK